MDIFALVLILIALVLIALFFMFYTASAFVSCAERQFPSEPVVNSLTSIYLVCERLELFDVDWLESVGFVKEEFDDGQGGDVRYVCGKLAFYPNANPEYQWEVNTHWVNPRSLPTKKIEVEALLKLFNGGAV